MIIGSIRTWEILTRVAYVSSIPVWIALLRRRRADLLVVAMFVQITSLLRQEQLEFIESETSAADGSSTMYTILYNHSIIEQVSLFAIDWGVAVVFIYSAALVSIFHERFAIAAVFAILVALRSTRTATALLIGFRLVVTIPLFTFYIYERFTRDTLILLNVALYVSGFAFFYSAFLLSVVPLVNTNPVVHVVIHFFWILLLNTGLFLIVLSIPATQKVNIVVRSETDWIHNSTMGGETEMRVILHEPNYPEQMRFIDPIEFNQFTSEQWAKWDAYLDPTSSCIHVLDRNKKKIS